MSLLCLFLSIYRVKTLKDKILCKKSKLCANRTSLRADFLRFFVTALFQRGFHLPRQIAVSAEVGDGSNVLLPAHLLAFADTMAERHF